MTDMLPLLVFSLVASGSPGPNNLILLGSGVQFGFARTLPHVAGTALGVAGVACGVAAGIGVLVETLPALELVLKAGGSAYLVYLAWRIGRGTLTGGAEVAGPLTIREATLFQAVNVKVWIFALAAMGTFRPRGMPLPAGSALTVAVMGAAVLATASVWAAGGTGMSRVVRSQRAQRLLRAVLALLLLASVAQLWR